MKKKNGFIKCYSFLDEMGWKAFETDMGDGSIPKNIDYGD